MIKLLLIAFCFLSHLFSAQAYKPYYSRNLPEFNGYQIEFDYEKYPNERKIAYDYYLNKVYKKDGYYKLAINDLGIDLYDIDNDGEKEVFVYMGKEEDCCRAGCPFAILNIVKEKNNPNFPYKKIQLEDTQEDSFTSRGNIKVLQTSALNFQDLLFCNNDGTPVGVTKYKGSHYDYCEGINFESLKDTYSVNFDRENYPVEREVAYKYFLNRLDMLNSFPIKKEDIGIDLYDIDQDGVQEIITILMPRENITARCDPQGRCPFAILKPLNEDKTNYRQMVWERDNIDAYKMIKILPALTNGYHDILFFNQENMPTLVWKWSKKQYNSQVFFDNQEYKQ